MAIIKLPDEGNTYTGGVRSCAEVEGTFGPQVKFEFDNGDTLFLPAASAVNQLIRCGFDGGNDGAGNPIASYEAVEGNTLTFSRTPNKRKGAKPYWNIEVADALQKAAARAPKPKRMTHEEALRGAPTDRREDVPPPSDDDLPWADDPPTPPSAPAPQQQPASRSIREVDYCALFERVARFQVALGKELDFPVDGSSVQAMTFSIFNGR